MTSQNRELKSINTREEGAGNHGKDGRRHRRVLHIYKGTEKKEEQSFLIIQLTTVITI